MSQEMRRYSVYQRDKHAADDKLDAFIYASKRPHRKWPEWSKKIYFSLDTSEIETRILREYPTHQEKSSMRQIESGPLKGLRVGDTAYTIKSGKVVVTSLTSVTQAGRPIRVRSVFRGIFGSYQTNGVQLLGNKRQSLFLDKASRNDEAARRGISIHSDVEIDDIQTKETTPVKTLESKTYLKGQDISTMSDDAIFSVIASMEDDIETLNKVSNKPQRLVKQVAKMRGEIKSIIDHLDATDVEATEAPEAAAPQ